MLIQGWTGLRNDVPIDRFEIGEAGTVDLSRALNVVIDNSLKISRRKGYNRILTADTHSLWADRDLCYYVEESILRLLEPDFTATAVRRDMMARQPVSYARIDDRVYYVNGFQGGVIEAGVNRSLGLDVPGPMSAREVNGNLSPGIYQHTLTYIRDDAQESGAVKGETITVSTGGIALTNIPVSNDPTVTRKVIYLTEPDGQIMYEALVLDNADTEATITEASLSVPLDTLHLCAPPVGHLAAIHQGHLFIADDSLLYRSKPFGFELFDVLDFLQLESRVTMLASLENGIFIGTEHETGIIAGATPEEFTYTKKSDYGVIEGSLVYTTARKLGFDGVDESPVALWQSKRGVCVGLSGGVMYNLTEPRYLHDHSGSRSASVIIDVDGSSVFVTTT